MLGELVYCSDRDGKLRRQERYGLTVLRAEVRPGGWGEAGRLKRTARRLARLGVRRVLVPEGFCRWELLSLFGPEPGLAGIRLRASALEPEDREKLPLMAALWESGRGERLGLEFT